MRIDGFCNETLESFISYDHVIWLFKVLEDLNLEEKLGKHKEDIQWLRSFLEENCRSLAYDGQQLYSLLHEASSSTALFSKWKDVIRKPPVLSLVAVSQKEIKGI